MTNRFAKPPILDRLPIGNAVIEASAGTGKTYTLEHLVVDRIVKGDELEQILVVTFTEKATREMRVRMRSTISDLVHAPANDPRRDPKGPAWTIDDAAGQRLRNALASFDRASIFTIHGFCQRVLADHAFESRRAVTRELVDPRSLFSDAFTAELRVLLGKPQSDPARALFEHVLSQVSLQTLEALCFVWSQERGRPMPEFREERMRASIDAIAALDLRAAERDLTRAIPQRNKTGQAMHLLRLLKAACDRSASMQEQVLAIDRFRHVPVTKKARAGSWLPALLAKSSSLASLHGAVEDALRDAPLPLAVVFASLIPQTIARTREVKARLAAVDFDDMLTHVADAIRAPRGASLIAALRSSYRCALVDEFQDTDAIQWSIFRDVFGVSPDHSLCVIGDPKQAIYGFRNADVHTYREARATLSDQPAALTTNYRSSAPMVDVFNTLFTNYFSGGDGPPAEHGPIARALRMPGESTPAPAAILIQPLADDAIGAARFRRALGPYIASEIRALVGRATVVTGGEDEESRLLRHGDVQILTRTANEALAIAEALRQGGVPFALFKQDGLFQSREAKDVLDLLRAIAEPDDRSARLRAWLTPFFDVALSELPALRDADASHPLVALLHRLHRLAMRRRFGDMFETIVRETGVLRRALFATTSERSVTNYQHLLELLLERASRRTLTELTRELASYVAGRAVPDSASGDLQRLESERNAVQILTMHKAKGLEAEVVFVAGGFARGGKQGPLATLAPHVCHAADGTREAWLRPALTREAAERVRAELIAEDERLLYVAVTRAKSRVYLPYFGAPPMDTDRVTTLKRIEGSYAALAKRLSALGPGVIDGARFGYAALDLDAEPEPLGADLGARERALDDAHFTPIRDDARRYEKLRETRGGCFLTSYTRMKSAASSGGFYVDATVSTPDDAERDEFKVDDASPSLSAPLYRPARETTLPGGASVGIFLHEVLEHLDYEAFSEPDHEAFLARRDVGRLFSRCAQNNGVAEEHIDEAARLLFDGMRVAVRTPHLDLPDGLCSIDGAREMSFHFPVPERAHPRQSAPRPSAQEMPFAIERGVIRGVVDLVFEHDGRVSFLDWKSDRVDDPRDDALAAHVARSYDLQAKLYTLATVRLLDVRSEEEYERRFGGLIYVFLRYLEDGQGVIHERPPFRTVLAWERELRESDAPFGYRYVEPR